MKLNWKNKAPKEFYPKAVKLFGKPNVVAKEKGGLAIWYPKKTNLYCEHVLRDESIKHCAPAHHIDYFYSFIKFYVPPKKRLDIFKISGSVSYDGLKKQIGARCASLEANIATNYLVMAVASGKFTIQQVDKKGLYGAYIRGEVKPYNELEKEMIQMKKENHKKYKKELKLEYDPLAFNQCGKS